MDINTFFLTSLSQYSTENSFCQAERKTAGARYIPMVLRRAIFALLGLVSGFGVGSKTRQTSFKMAALEQTTDFGVSDDE